MLNVNNKTKKFWWEKTIEYLFVMNHVNVEDLVVPLDGTHEVSGDAIIGRVAKWVLIEFKRDESSLDSEITKYGDQKNFNDAKQALIFESGHHFLIYGVLEQGKLSLKTKGYFNLEDYEIEAALSNGKDPKTFNSYLSRLTKFKKSKASSEDSAGGRAVNYNRVIGINENGDVSECLTIQEYANRYANDLTLKASAKLENDLNADTSLSPKYTRGPN